MVFALTEPALAVPDSLEVLAILRSVRITVVIWERVTWKCTNVDVKMIIKVHYKIIFLLFIVISCGQLREVIFMNRLLGYFVISQ